VLPILPEPSQARGGPAGAAPRSASLTARPEPARTPSQALAPPHPPAPPQAAEFFALLPASARAWRSQSPTRPPWIQDFDPPASPPARGPPPLAGDPLCTEARDGTGPAAKEAFYSPAIPLDPCLYGNPSFRGISLHEKRARSETGKARCYVLPSRGRSAPTGPVLRAGVVQACTGLGMRTAAGFMAGNIALRLGAGGWKRLRKQGVLSRNRLVPPWSVQAPLILGCCRICANQNSYISMAAWISPLRSSTVCSPAPTPGHELTMLSPANKST